ncbi:MAG: hypothetical protein F7C38_00005, partial [Desulfurococcales archaeon]|nr:hypothetical protein [Desulfurococcales archaeon]
MLVSIKNPVRELFGVLKRRDFAIDMLGRYTEMLHEFDITVLRDHAEPKELLEAMRIYRLTPSDAIIALT